MYHPLNKAQSACFHVTSYISYIPYSRKLTLQEINAKIDFFALILEALILGDVNFGDLNFLEC